MASSRGYADTEDLPRRIRQQEDEISVDWTDAGYPSDLQWPCPQQMNNYIAHRIQAYTDDELCKLELFCKYRVDFKGWTFQMFWECDHDICETFQHFLHKRGISLKKMRLGRGFGAVPNSLWHLAEYGHYEFNV
ncbi:hypothetical protein E4U40_007697 [Claviceps sp. LM458 group G5]|nr:hypothetical protein E4U40_007697 [Claviceps sp. LM458 group G5]